MKGDQTRLHQRRSLQPALDGRHFRQRKGQGLVPLRILKKLPLQGFTRRRRRLLIDGEQVVQALDAGVNTGGRLQMGSGPDGEGAPMVGHGLAQMLPQHQTRRLMHIHRALATGWKGLNHREGAQPFVQPLGFAWRHRQQAGQKWWIAPMGGRGSQQSLLQGFTLNGRFIWVGQINREQGKQGRVCLGGLQQLHALGKIHGGQRLTPSIWAINDV